MNKTEDKITEDYKELEKELSLLRNFIIADAEVAHTTYSSITKSFARRSLQTEGQSWFRFAHLAKFASVTLVAVALVILVGFGRVSDPLLDTSDGIAIASTESELAMIDDMDKIMLNMEAEMAEMDIASLEI